MRVTPATSHSVTAAGRRAVAYCLWAFALLSAFTSTAATFGTVVPIGGHASDIALDEKRGVLYIANFTANQIDVMSLRTNTIERSINVARQPGALAVSRDGQWLMITHFGETESATRYNAVTVIRLDDNSRREFSLGSAPLGVAFGANDIAFIVTATEFIAMEPVSGHVRTIATIQEVISKELPVALATFPPQITQATVTASRDGSRIYAIAEKILVHYDVAQGHLGALTFTASPELGPRTLSVSADGSYYAAGWWVIDPAGGYIRSEFANPKGAFEIGSHVIDQESGVIYAQIPPGGEGCNTPDDIASDGSRCGDRAASQRPGGRPGIDPTAPRLLKILAADNLQLLEQVQLPENLAGRSILNLARDTMYAVSDSGVMVLPVGRLRSQPRVRAEQNTLVFRNNGCSAQLQTRDIAIVDPGGNNTPFVLVPSAPGVRVSSSFGTTPAVVQVTVDPALFARRGTSSASIDIQSAAAVNLADPIRIHVNNREPDQRGTTISVPGQLADVLADPSRNRFYVLRQDTYEVLVFDAATYRQIAALRTGTNPTQMAITMDNRYLLVVNSGSQTASVFDLATLQTERPIVFPAGHFPRRIAVSGKAILAVSRVTGGAAPGMIDRIDIGSRTAITSNTLGIYKNDVQVESALAATPNGSSILVAMPNGNVMLYDANKDTFTVSRKDFDKLSGAHAASNYGSFVVGNNLLNASLVRTGTLDQNNGIAFAFTDQTGFLTTASAGAPAATISRLDVGRGATVLPTSLTEAPILPTDERPFIRTLAPLPNRSAIVSLSTTGLTVLPWNYDAAFAPPRIERVVSAADRSDALAPGGLITIFGTDLSPFDANASDATVADALPEACLMVNGSSAPIVFASPTRLNAQLPFNADGTTTLILRTPGGTSDSFRLRLSPGAPSIFRTGTAGPDTGLPTVVRATNNDLVTLSNPIHPGDEIVIYAAGLGRTTPEVPAGTPAPYEPLAIAVSKPTVQLGGVDLNVFFAGLAPGQVGVYQINAIVPRNVPLGFDIPLTVQQGDQATTLNVRVVR